MATIEFASALYNLGSLPTPDPAKAQVHTPLSYRFYKPESARQITKLFPVIRLQESAFSNGMWLLLAGEAPSVVMPWIMNGDNLADAMLDMFNAHVLTQPHDKFGPNVGNLSILAPFADFRQDLPSKKDFSGALIGEAIEEVAMVTAQASWTWALATLMRYTANVQNLVTIDGHSYIARQQFNEVGIEVVNITTAKLMIEYLRNIGLLSDNLATMIVGVDLGNLSLAYKLHQEEGFEIGVIHKHRISIGDGGRSQTEHELVYGDVRGKRVILMDDMIGSGGTILKTISLLLQHGVAEIIVCASHAVFAGREYYEQLQEVLKNDKVKIVLLSDTLPLTRPTRGADKDLPYVIVPNAQGEAERREVDMLSVDDFIAYIIGVMLSDPTAAGISKKMGQHVVDQVDPFDLYYLITGKKLPRPTPVAKYLSGGRIERQ